MPSLILECPHCGAPKIGFSIIFDATAVQPPPKMPSGSLRFRSMLICSNCDGPVIGVFDRPQKQGPQQPMQCGIDPRQLGFTLTETYPKPAPSKMPTHITDELRRYFAQAESSLRRGDWDASGAMSRKVVDVSAQQLLAADSPKFRDIKGRIDELANRNQLTPELKDWAHQVRLGGNDAAHDEDPFTEPEADELLDFTELYLTYVYTLPGRLAERKARAAAAKAAAGAKS